MATGPPNLGEPRGQLSPASVFRFKFPPAPADKQTSYDIQVSEDRSFATVTNWDGRNLTAGMTPYRGVWAPYGGPGLAAGRIYYWRARGYPGPGRWSRIAMFSLDPRAASEPFANWARALMGTWGYPRPLTVLNTLLPTGGRVRVLLLLGYLGRMTVRDDEHPPVTDRVLELLGWNLHVDRDAGWEVQVVTHDLIGPAT